MYLLCVIKWKVVLLQDSSSPGKFVLNSSVFLVELTCSCFGFLTTELPLSLFSCLWTKSFGKVSDTYFAVKH